MNEEIKEILDDLKNEDKYIEEYGFRYKRIALDDVWQLLDYITNLQQENEKCDKEYTKLIYKYNKLLENKEIWQRVATKNFNDSEDIFGGDYTSEIELKHLEKAYNQLQTRWDSLREWVMQLKNSYMETDNIFDDAKFRIILTILDKMNELEGEEDDKNS